MQLPLKKSKKLHKKSKKVKKLNRSAKTKEINRKLIEKIKAKVIFNKKSK